MSSLMKIGAEYQYLYDLMTDVDADPQVINDTLDAVKGELEVKAMDYINVIKILEAEKNYAEAQKEFFEKRAEIRDNNIKRMKETIKQVLIMTGHDKTGLKVGDAYILKVQGNGGKQPMVITGEVPQTYTKVVIEPDNSRIRETLESGKELPFAHLEPRGTHLKIK